MMGMAVSASAASAVLAGCEVEQAVSWKPTFLTTKQVNLVAEVAERIVPRTSKMPEKIDMMADSLQQGMDEEPKPIIIPGAKDVKVERFIDVLLEKYMKKAELTQFMAGLADVDKKSMDKHSKAFIDLSDEEKDGILKAMASEASEIIKNQQPSEGGTPPPKPFFVAVKELSLLGYFSSEEVGKTVLAYDPIPGGYENCIPLEQNGGVNWSG